MLAHGASRGSRGAPCAWKPQRGDALIIRRDDRAGLRADEIRGCPYVAEPNADFAFTALNASPLRGFRGVRAANPRLAPWANMLRRYAAPGNSSAFICGKFLTTSRSRVR